MGGRLNDWLGQDIAANRPVAATVAGLTQPFAAAIFFANDTKILSVYDDAAVDWLDIDVAAFASLSFQSLPDVDWSTPPTDGQVFVWDTVSSKLIPSDFPAGFTAEDAMDTMDAAFTAGTHVGLTITYDDVGNAFDFELDDVYIQGLADGQIAAASIEDLSDVHALAGIADGQVLMWSTANSRFEFGTPSTVGSIDDLTDVDTTTDAPVVGDSFVWDGTNWVPGLPLQGNMAILAEVTAPTSNALEVTGLTLDDYQELQILVTGLESNAAFNVQIQFYLDGVLQSSSGDYYIGSYSAATSETNSAYGSKTPTSVLAFDTTSTNYQPSAAAIANFACDVRDPAGTQFKNARFDAQHNDGASAVGSYVNGGFTILDGGKITGVLITSSNGVLDAGKLSIRAIRKATNSVPISFSGSAFPSSPSVGQRFYRSDRGIEYFWDGTNWLSTQLFTIAFSDGGTSRSADVVGLQRIPVPYKGVYGIWLESWESATYINATAVWQMQLVYADSANVQTTITSTSTSGDTANQWSHHSVAIGAQLSTNAFAIYFNADEISGSSTTACTAMLHYRLMG